MKTVPVPPSVPPDAAPSADVRACPRCATELAADALACPACGSLVHAERLREIAARAESLGGEGKLAESRTAWEEALALLPPHARQRDAIVARVAALDAQARDGAAASAKPAVAGPWWKRGVGAAVAIAFLLVGKLKFLLLGLTKLKTLVSMFAFFGVYWTTFGWPLALGIVLSIYVHEMGHVAMLKRLGIDASAPMFVPFVGAFVLLKQKVTDPRSDAAIGLAGPVWGLGAGLAALAAYGATRAPVWLAIAQITGFLNLFNLIPVWQLDGARGVHALSTVERWALVASLAAAFALTHQKLLLVVGAVVVWRALQRTSAGPGDRRVAATFAALVLALSWLSVQHAV